jgi:hypothetical protein
MQLTTALAASPQSPASMRRSKSSLGKAARAGHLPTSPLSTASNNLIPISYNELEVTDQLQQPGAESAPPATSRHQIGLDDFELIKVSVGRVCQRCVRLLTPVCVCVA